MLERVDEEKLTTLLIPENEFKWYNPGHEIVVGGKMFDVKSIQRHNGAYEIKGLFDEHETELNNIEEDYSSNKEGNSSKSPHRIFQICLGIIGITNYISDINYTLVELKPTHFIKYNSDTLDGFLHQLEIPPNFYLA